MRNSSSLLFVLVCALCLNSLAKGDTLTMTGKLTSDSTAVSPSDPIITNPNNIVLGSSLSMILTYDPSAFTKNGNTYMLTNANFNLSFDGYMFTYSSASGGYIAVSFPGAYGAGTVSFQICTSAAACASPTGDFINLYYSGTVTSLAAMASQASGLSGYSTASPSQYEFLRNFSDFSQTDLQGTLKPPSSVAPEPSTLLMLVSGGVAFVFRRVNRGL